MVLETFSLRRPFCGRDSGPKKRGLVNQARPIEPLVFGVSSPRVYITNGFYRGVINRENNVEGGCSMVE